MLDTNICIYVINQRPAALAERFNDYLGEMCISSITYAELMHGIEKSTCQDQNRAQVRTFCQHLAIFDFDRSAGEQYGRIKALLETRGHPIGANDFLIAAHAISQNLTLVSNNTREFERVDGLKLENWVASSTQK